MSAYNLLIDDSRTEESIAERIGEPYDRSLPTHLAKNCAEWTSLLESHGPPAFVSFDYWLDPGMDDNVVSEGLPRLIAECCRNHEAFFPLYEVHSNCENGHHHIAERVEEILSESPELRDPTLDYNLLERRRKREEELAKLIRGG